LTSYTLELRVKVIRIIDGDTFTGVITQGFDGFRGSDDHPVKVRCALINAPEMKTGAGPAAKAYAETLLAVGNEYPCTSYKPDEYGRYLLDIHLPDGRLFSAAMLAAGQAVLYR
jgi:endonuclease YncB( thermonuclease family)